MSNKRPLVFLNELRVYGILVEYRAHYSTVQYMDNDVVVTENIANDEIEFYGDPFDYEHD